jgi:hypothetical protein
MISDGNSSIDVSRLRAAIAQIKFDLSDVRTTRSDPQSSKQFCAATLSAAIPASLINDANATRKLRGEPSVSESAILSDLKLEGNILSHDLEYSVQPTDNGQKIFAETQNSDLPLSFLNQLMIDALQKSVIQAEQAQQQQIEMQNQQAQAEQDAMAEQEAQAQAAQQYADQSAYAQLQQQEAQLKLDAANQKLNLIWNSASKATRNRLLADQRLWLKKRDLECRLNSAEAAADQQALLNIRCQTSVTEQRLAPLRQTIEQLDSSAATDAAASNAAAEDNAARMAANLGELERKLSNF